MPGMYLLKKKQIILSIKMWGEYYVKYMSIKILNFSWNIHSSKILVENIFQVQQYTDAPFRFMNQGKIERIGRERETDRETEREWEREWEIEWERER